MIPAVCGYCKKLRRCISFSNIVKFPLKELKGDCISMLYYDVLFRNVEIFDGTGSESYVADVALKGDKIEKIGKVTAEGIVEGDGKGLSLAPGFVDVHTHSDTQLFSEPSRMCKVKQGVTFEIGGQCGWSRGPSVSKMPQPGYDADLVLFNKDAILDQATYAHPFLPNIGIEMVFVSGQAAVVNNQPTGVFNGKVYKPAK